MNFCRSHDSTIKVTNKISHQRSTGFNILPPDLGCLKKRGIGLLYRTVKIIFTRVNAIT